MGRRTKQVKNNRNRKERGLSGTQGFIGVDGEGIISIVTGKHEYVLFGIGDDQIYKQWAICKVRCGKCNTLIESHEEFINHAHIIEFGYRYVCPEQMAHCYKCEREIRPEETVHRLENGLPECWNCYRANAGL